MATLNELKQEVSRLLQETTYTTRSAINLPNNLASISSSSSAGSAVSLSPALAEVVKDALFTSDFGSRPREWIAAISAAIEQQLPGLAPELKLYQNPTFEDRVLGVLLRVHLSNLLQLLERAVAGVQEHHKKISEQFSTYREAKNNCNRLTFEVQYQVLNNQIAQFEQDIPLLFTAYLKLATDASVVLRLATNLVLFRVSEWKTRQRRLANQAETRDRRQARGQHVKTSHSMLLELDQLGAHVERLGEALHTMFNEARLMQQEAPTQFQMSFTDRQTLDGLHEQPQKMVTLLATYTLVMYNQPLQVLKKHNRFSVSMLWLAGPLLSKFGMNAQLLKLRARLVPGRESEGEPWAPQLQPPDPNDKTAAFLIDSQSVSFAAPSAGRGSRRVNSASAASLAYAGGGPRKGFVAKFVRLKWTRKERGTRQRKGSKPSVADDAMDEEGDESDGSPIDSPSVSTLPKARQPSGDTRMCVTDRLHFVLVESDPIIMPDNTQVTLQEVSFPIVLIVNIVQECQAMFTILWRNAFESAEEVTWNAFQQEIAALFQSRTTISTRAEGPTAKHSNVVGGRGVPESQLEYLRQRFLKSNQSANSNDAGIVRLYDLKNNKFKEQLRKSDPKSCKQFTLIEYLHSAVKLVSHDELTKRLWVQQVIWGFISKEEARDVLLAHAATQSGMLVRFSEKQLGAVSVVRYSPKSECASSSSSAAAVSGSVDVVEPWDTKALEKEALIVRLFAKAKSLKLIFSPPDALILAAKGASSTFAAAAAFSGAGAAADVKAHTKLRVRDAFELLKSINNNAPPPPARREVPDGYESDHGDSSTSTYFYEQYMEQLARDCPHAGWNLTALMRSRRYEQGTDITDECKCPEHCVKHIPH